MARPPRTLLHTCRSRHQDTGSYESPEGLAGACRSARASPEAFPGPKTGTPGGA